MILRHNRLQEMMGGCAISDKNALLCHLRFFANDRKQRVEEITASNPGLKSDLPSKYDKPFFDEYFSDQKVC